MGAKIKFTKPSLSIGEHLALLRDRGLIINSEEDAAHYLKFIGYYRLSGYALPFTKKYFDGSHDFKAGVTFEQILDLYKFDRELRLLVMDAVERIEVAFRTCVSNHLCEKAGPHWYFNESVFHSSKSAWDFTRKVMDDTGYRDNGMSEGRDVFLEHYFSKYSQPPLPPSWMIAEVLSISTWSKAFESLKAREDRKRIAQNFGMAPEVLGSWIHCVSYVRNLCAHHARLWNREFTIRPMIANEYKAQLANNRRLFAQAFVLKILLERACPNTKWWEKLAEFVGKRPSTDRVAMGFADEA